MIWAQARDGVIGEAGDMPWRLPEDMARFKAVTMGHPVVMGRRTWESFPERYRPLPGRDNIVITSDRDYVAPGATIVRSLDEALWGRSFLLSVGERITGHLELRGGRIPAEKMGTHTFTFDQMDEAYAVFADAAANLALKVVITP